MTIMDTAPSSDVGETSAKCAEGGCTACGTIGRHTAEECSARRPRCHIHGCGRPTCIQAMHHGDPPTCLDHYFNQSRVETAERIAEDHRARADYWMDRARHWQTECGILVDEQRFELIRRRAEAKSAIVEGAVIK